MVRDVVVRKVQALYSEFVHNLRVDFVKRGVKLRSMLCEEGVKCCQTFLSDVIKVRSKQSLLVGKLQRGVVEAGVLLELRSDIGPLGLGESESVSAA